MATVIDELIIKLGLDPKDFSAGSKKAAADYAGLKDSVKQNSEEINSRVTATSARFLALVEAAKLLIQAGKYVADIATQTRRLGIESRNFNLSAAALRNWQNAVEMAGGKAEDATKTIGDMQKALFDLNFMGTISPGLEMLARLGVRFQDSTGKARNFQDIVEDTADALERAQKSGTMNRTEAYFAAREAGFDEGTAQLILSGRSGVRAGMSQQQQRWQVGERDVQTATSIDKARIDIDQRLQSLRTQSPDELRKGVDFAKEALDAFAGKVDNVTQRIGNAVDNALGQPTQAELRSRAGTVPRGMNGRRVGGDYSSAIRNAEKKYGIPEGVLHGLIRQESNFNPKANSGQAVGIAQFKPLSAKDSPAHDLGFTPGVDPMLDIDMAGKYLSQLHGRNAKAGYAGQEAWHRALTMYHSGIGNVEAGKIGPVGRGYADSVMSHARQAVPTPGAGGARGAGGTVVVGPVTINTAATDAQGIARDMRGAVQRKMDLAQADAGLR